MQREQQAALVQQAQYAATCSSNNSKVKIKSLASSDKKVKVKVPKCEKIEGRSVMQHLLLVQIGNDAGVRPNIRRKRSRAASADCVLPHHI